VLDIILSFFGISSSFDSIAGRSLRTSVRKHRARTIAKKYSDPFVQLCCFAIYTEEKNIMDMFKPREGFYHFSEDEQHIWSPVSLLPWYELEKENEKI
jgi:hypothetical protein